MANPTPRPTSGADAFPPGSDAVRDIAKRTRVAKPKLGEIASIRRLVPPEASVTLPNGQTVAGIRGGVSLDYLRALTRSLPERLYGGDSLVILTEHYAEVAPA